MSGFVRIGVVGAGSISIRGIMPHLSQKDLRDRVRMAAVCDPEPGRAAAAAGRFSIPKSFITFEELLASGDVDAVTIASPIGFHYEQGKQALLAGKHIHFNKTMTTTVAEADELIDLASAIGMRLADLPIERFLHLLNGAGQREAQFLQARWRGGGFLGNAQAGSERAQRNEYLVGEAALGQFHVQSIAQARVARVRDDLGG